MKRSAMPPPWDAKPDKPRKADPISPEVRSTVRGRARGLCELCQGSGAVHFHHRQLRRSGDHSVPNIVFLCSTCHQRIHGHVRWALDTGWIVSAYDSAALREVLYQGREWTYLGAGGELLTLPPAQEACS